MASFPEARVQFLDELGRDERLGPRYHYSWFFVTLNTNKGITPQNPRHDLVENFDIVADDWLDHPEEWVKFGDVEGGRFVEREPRAMDVIYDYDAKVAYEVGKKFKKYHGHFFIQFKHNTILQLDGRRIKEYFTSHILNDAGGDEGLFDGMRVDIVHIPASANNIMRYMRKSANDRNRPRIPGIINDMLDGALF